MIATAATKAMTAKRINFSMPVRRGQLSERIQTRKSTTIAVAIQP